MKLKNLIAGFLLLSLIMGSVNAECAITLNAPEDNYYTTDTTPDFNYTITGNFSDYNVTLYFDSIAYGVNETSTNNTAIIITANATMPYSEAKEWYLFSGNDSNFNCTSEVRDLTIGKTHFQGVNSLINLVLDTVGLFPTIISLVIYAGLLVIVGMLITWIVKFFKKR